MFDQLSRGDVCHENRAVERAVHLPEQTFATLARDAEDDPIGVHKIMERGALAEKLGIAGHVERHRPSCQQLNLIADPFSGPDRDRALLHDQPVTI